MADVDTTMLAGQHADIRREGAEHAAEIRYDVATRAGDIRREGAEHASDIRREQAVEFGDTRYDTAEQVGSARRELADVKDVLNDSIRVEGGNTRFQAAKDTSEIIKEGLKGTHEVFAAVRDNRYDLASRIENAADRTERGIAENRLMTADRFYAVGRDLAEIRQGQATLGKDVELNALRTQLDAKDNTRYITDKVAAEGEKTRDLIQDLKYHDLNRGLIERQTELINCEQDRRGYRDRYHDGRFDMLQTQFAGQWAQLQNQVQAFQSQLQETRQGMVNFGTMSGQSGQQTSTSNNVR